MKKITVIFITLFFLVSCQSTKDAFTLKKKSSTDEFLVEKKNPLVLPPGYGKLPMPQDGQIIDDEVEDGDLNVFVIDEVLFAAMGVIIAILLLIFVLVKLLSMY